MSDLYRVGTNIAALRAYHTLSGINSKILDSAERISTGKINNRSSDGPANYYVSKILQRKINRLDTESANVERGINWLQNQDSKYAQVVNILSEMSSLVQTAKAGGITSAERVAIQMQLNDLKDEVGDILQSGIDGRITAGTAVADSGFDIGNMTDLKLTGTGIGSNQPTYATIITTDLGSMNVTGSWNAAETSIDAAYSSINTAMDRVLRAEEKIGTWIKRLEFQVSDFQTESLDTQAILSSINDADLAKEQMDLTKLQILQNTAQAMFSQNNQAPMMVLQFVGR
jgi:flagellin